MSLDIESATAPSSFLKPSTIQTGRLVAPSLSLSTSLSSTLAPSTLTSPTLAPTPCSPYTPCTLLTCSSPLAGSALKSPPTPRNPQAHLPALPHELLLIIISLLDDESLYALTRTNRSLHYLVIPYLLHKYDIQDPHRGWVVLFNHPVQIVPILRSALFFHSPRPSTASGYPHSPSQLTRSIETEKISSSALSYAYASTSTSTPTPTPASSAIAKSSTDTWSSGDSGYRQRAGSNSSPAPGTGGISQIHVHFVGGKGCFKRFYHDAKALERLMRYNGHGYIPALDGDGNAATNIDTNAETDAHFVDPNTKDVNTQNSDNNDTRLHRNNQALGTNSCAPSTGAYARNNAGGGGGVGMKLLKLHLSNLDSWVSELRYRVMDDDDDGEEDDDEELNVGETPVGGDADELGHENENEDGLGSGSILLPQGSDIIEHEQEGDAHGDVNVDDDDSDNDADDVIDSASDTGAEHVDGRLTPAQAQACRHSQCQCQRQRTPSLSLSTRSHLPVAPSESSSPLSPITPLSPLSQHLYSPASSYAYTPSLHHTSNREIDLAQFRRTVTRLLETAIVERGCQEVEVRSGQRLVSIWRDRRGGGCSYGEEDGSEMPLSPSLPQTEDTRNSDSDGAAVALSPAPSSVPVDSPKTTPIKSAVLYKRIGNKVVGMLRSLRRKPGASQADHDAENIDEKTLLRDHGVDSTSAIPANIADAMSTGAHIPTTILSHPSSPSPNPAPGTTNSSLQSFTLQSTFLLHPPFQQWTISLLNGSSRLTRLAIENVRLEARVWRNVLGRIRLEAVEDVCFVQSDGGGVGGGGLGEDDEFLAGGGPGGGERRRDGPLLWGIMLEDLYDFLRRHEETIEKLKVLGHYQSWRNMLGDSYDAGGDEGPGSSSSSTSTPNQGSNPPPVVNPLYSPPPVHQPSYTNLRAHIHPLFATLTLPKLKEVWAYPLFIGMLLAPGPEKMKGVKRITIVSGDNVGVVDLDWGFAIGAGADAGGGGATVGQQQVQAQASDDEEEQEVERQLRRSDYEWFGLALKDVARFTGGTDPGHDYTGDEVKEAASPPSVAAVESTNVQALESPRPGRGRRTSWKRSFSMKKKRNGAGAADRPLTRSNSVRSITTPAPAAAITRTTTSQNIQQREFTLQLQCLSGNGLAALLRSQTRKPITPPTSSEPTPQLAPHQASALHLLQNITELQIGSRWYWDFDEQVVGLLPKFWSEFPDLRRIVVCDQTEEVREKLFGEAFWRRVGRMCQADGGGECSDDEVDGRRKTKLETARFNSMGLQVWDFELGTWGHVEY
ncbi:hypothetical protein AX16_005782 [Volvariella volvacea WC 439]|nr:hypothetical protein AX16_005782 [Volvariella volvacea WC 439]